MLWGACDPLETPRPLGPLLDVAEAAGGELFAAAEAGARPGALARRAAASSCERRLAPCSCSRTCTGPTRARLTCCACSGGGSSGVPALAVATLPDDELARPPATARARRAGDARRRRADPRPAAVAPRRSRELAAPHGVDGNDLHQRTGGNPFYVTEVLSAAGRDDPGNRPRRRARPRGVAERRCARGADPAVDRAWCGRAGADRVPTTTRSTSACVSGMVRLDGHAIAFRHELARLAVEAEIPPRRRAALHRDVLERARGARCRPGATARHHAEAAADGPAVLRHATEAGERAARLGAHRAGGRAVRPRAALRRRDMAAAERAVLLEKLVLRVLPDRPDRGGDRGPPGVARAAARAR